MQLIQHIFHTFLSIAEKVLDACENGVDYSQFQRELQEKFNQLGCEICREVLEAHDQYLLRNRSQRKGWHVERRNDSKEVLSPFGPVRYKRTYFKGPDGYAHLVDQMAGLGPHARLDNTLKATLVEKAVDMSYRKSGIAPSQHAPGVDVSGQTVMNTIRGFNPAAVKKKESKVKRRVRFLYIEADEDHVARTKGRSMQIKLVYVHEGKEYNGKRAKLINPYYFSGKYDSTEALWFDVATYIANTYEVESIETIFIAGDGAPWIRGGKEYFPNSVFILDRFHLCKYVLRAVGRYPDLKKSLWRAIKQDDIILADDILQEALTRAESKTHKKAIRDCFHYIKTNWDGIQAYREYPAAVGCSAEGHVSHILSSRLSSRPQGWSREGAEKMASLRVLKANGFSVKDEYLSQRSTNTFLLKACKDAIHQQRLLLKQQLSQVMRGNLPALKGHTTYLTKALRGLSQASSL